MIYGLFFVTLHAIYESEKMKTTTIFLLCASLLAACAGTPTRARRSESRSQQATTQSEPKRYGYRVVATYPHSTESYTQGLQYVDGVLWEGTGQYGQSLVRRTDLATGKSEVVVRLPQSEFGEGITLLDGRFYQLTWKSNTAHLYDPQQDFKKIRDFRYPGEGWGLTTDGTKLYMSNGSANIYTLDPATFRRERHITVTFKGVPVEYINELEWIDGRIWANVYTTDQILIIDPTTGRVEGVVDLKGILPANEITPTTDVLNGIAYDAAARRIFVTGKNWSKLFEIEIIEQ